MSVLPPDRSMGPVRVVHAPHHGRRSEVRARQSAALRKLASIVARTHPTALGYAQAMWSTESLHDLFLRLGGLPVRAGTLWGLLRQAGLDFTWPASATAMVPIGPSAAIGRVAAAPGAMLATPRAARGTTIRLHCQARTFGSSGPTSRCPARLGARMQPVSRIWSRIAVTGIGPQALRRLVYVPASDVKEGLARLIEELHRFEPLPLTLLVHADGMPAEGWLVTRSGRVGAA